MAAAGVAIAGISAEQQKALLSDPQVQAALKNAGEAALNDPAVQKQILDTCKEKFPELASQAATKIKEWANDPAVQAQAKEYAGLALHYAGVGASMAGEQFNKLIEQGPAGVRLLAFGGGVAALVKAVLTFMGLLNPLTIFTGLVFYVLVGYQVIFALTTMLFEAPTEWVEKIPGLSAYQDLLIEKAKFLSEVGGRGLFYGFQGTLWLCFASFTELFNFVLGVYFLFLFALHVGMAYGIMPKEIVDKVAGGARSVAAAVGATQATNDIETGKPEPAAPAPVVVLKEAATKEAATKEEPKKEELKKEEPKKVEPSKTPETEPLLAAEPASPVATPAPAAKDPPAPAPACCSIQ